MRDNAKGREKLKKDIRSAAMEIIGLGGFEGLTARKIVKYMGLKNVSLINYYFGSREELIVETLKNNYFDVMREVHRSMDERKRPEEKLVDLFEKMMGIFIKYPYLIKLFYFDEIKRVGGIKGRYIDKLTELQNEIVARNLGILKQVTGIRDEKALWLKLYQLRGAMMFPPLAQRSNSELADYFSNEKNRRDYIEDIVRMLGTKDPGQNKAKASQ